METKNDLEYLKENLTFFINKYNIKELMVNIEEKPLEFIDASNPDKTTTKEITISIDY